MFDLGHFSGVKLEEGFLAVSCAVADDVLHTS